MVLFLLPSWCRSQGRASYAGSRLLHMAKTMEGCAHGGQVLLSEGALSALGQASLPASIAVVHMGKHAAAWTPQAARLVPQAPHAADQSPFAHARLTPQPPEDAALESQDTGGDHSQQITALGSRALTTAAPAAPSHWPSPQDIHEVSNVEYLHIYMAMHTQLVPRLLTMPPLKVADTLVSSSGACGEGGCCAPSRVAACVHACGLERRGGAALRVRWWCCQVLDIMHAPLDVVSMAFMYIVGFDALRAWDAQEASAAHELFADFLAKRQLRAAGGYVVSRSLWVPGRRTDLPVQSA